MFDSVRTGQFRSHQSRHIRKFGAAGDEIRRAGKRAIKSATAVIRASYAELPAERSRRRRVLQPADGKAVVESAKTAPTRRKRVRVTDEDE